MLRIITGLAALFALAASPAHAAVEGEIAFVFNTFSFLVHGFLVMLMAAGFAMLESGLVRTKNTAAICLKNIALYSIAGIMFYIVGYAVMYTDVNGGWIGTFDFLYNPSEAELALLNAEEATAEQVAAVVEGGYSVMSDWFFQMVFVATAASIVSGTLAERIRILPFLIFTVLLSALMLSHVPYARWPRVGLGTTRTRINSGIIAAAIVTAIAMPFTYSIATGIGLGFIAYALIKVLAGRRHELNVAVATVAVLFAIRFVVT